MLKNTLRKNTAVPRERYTGPEYRPSRFTQVLALRDMLNMEVLARNLPYIMFLGFLGILYIANSHYAVKTIREINYYQEELKKMSWESNARRSELMYSTMQSEIAKRVNNLGLQELNEKPEKIRY